MTKSHQLDNSIQQIFRIASTLVPNKTWHTIHVEGYIVGSTTEVKSWYILTGSSIRIEYDTFDLDYINQDSDNNEIGNFVEKMRELTYDTSRGAWYTVAIDFYKNGSQPTIQYNYYDLPKFEVPVPVTAYRKDLKVFPRPVQAIPDWLK